MDRDCQRKSRRQCKFPADFYEQAVRDKLTFSCKEDTYKLKLYDEGAALSLEKAVKILSLKEATKRELQESKTAEIQSGTPRGNRPDMPLEGGIAQQRKHDAASAIKWEISLPYARVYL